jgi:hypothetical protein
MDIEKSNLIEEVEKLIKDLAPEKKVNELDLIRLDLSNAIASLKTEIASFDKDFEEDKIEAAESSLNILQANYKAVDALWKYNSNILNNLR